MNELCRESRKTFDTSETVSYFGLVVIDYAKVQSKVNVKYDTWHRDVLNKFASMLGAKMRERHASLAKSRADLEQRSLSSAASTSDALAFIHDVQEYRARVDQWSSDMSQFAHGQRMLEHQRYQFSDTWLYADNVAGEFGAFSELLARKHNDMQSRIGTVKERVLLEQASVDAKTESLIRECEADKPASGAIDPRQAMDMLDTLQTKLDKVREERQLMSSAKQILDVREANSAASVANARIYEEQLEVTGHELTALRNVWQEMSGVQRDIDELKDKQWLAVQPKRVKATLDALATKLSELPARMRRFDVYDYYNKLVESCSTVSSMCLNLSFL